MPLPRLVLVLLAGALMLKLAPAQTPIPIATGWQLQDSAKVTAAPELISAAKFKPENWFTATVPGTVLTTLVNNKVYPEPLYGENNAPDSREPQQDQLLVPHSFCHPARLRGTPYLAALRWHQLLVGDMGQRPACRNYARCFHPYRSGYLRLRQARHHRCARCARRPRSRTPAHPLSIIC